MNPALIATATLNHTVPDIFYWVNPAKANKAGKLPVSMRVTLQGQRTEVSTGIRCLPEEWNKAAKRLQSVEWSEKKQAYVVLRQPADAVVHLNTLLDSLEAKTRLLAADMRQAQAANKPLILKELRMRLLGEVELGPDILTSLDELMNVYPNPSTRATFLTTIRHLRRFLAPRVALHTFDITPSLGVQFKAWATKDLGETGALRHTLLLHSLFNKLRLPITNPFADLAKGKPKHKKPRYVLSFEEIEQLAQLALPEGSDEAVARDIYLTQYYLHGSRVGVMLELPWKQVDMQRARAQFKAEKGGRWHNVEMQPELVAIFGKYQGQASPLVFPLLPTNYLELSADQRFPLRKTAGTRIWKGLQKIAALMNLPGKLHSHTARHTLATHTVEVTGDMRLAQHLLGHSSLGMTENYVRGMMHSVLDKGVSQVYSRGRTVAATGSDDGGHVVPMWKEGEAA